MNQPSIILNTAARRRLRAKAKRATDARTDALTWVDGTKKDSGLCIALLRKLLTCDASRRVIRVIPDNHGLHASRRTRAGLADHGRRIRLHVLPP